MSAYDIHAYYKDKSFCRLDMDNLNMGFTNPQMPSSHPYIEFLILLDSIRKRNRYQDNLREVEKCVTDKRALSIHSAGGRTFIKQDVIDDLKRRIRETEIKIESFHQNYII